MRIPGLAPLLVLAVVTNCAHPSRSVTEGQASPLVAATSYTRRDVVFNSGALRMAGTLWSPRVSHAVPAVILIHGSGQTDRSTMNYYAEIFASHGIAALTYDKRGVGKSEGPPFAWRDYDFGLLAGDASAGIDWLRQQPDILAGQVGIFAASQGGWIAPLAAAASHPAFMVIVSGSVTTTAEDNLFERDARLRFEGFTPDEVAEAHAMHLVDLEVSRSGNRWDEFVGLWNANRNKRWFKRVYADSAPIGANRPYRRWYRTVMDFDPVPILQRMDVPVLWFYGDAKLDRFCPVEQSIAALERLREAGRSHVIKSFAGADHSLRVGRGDAEITTPLLAWLTEVVQR